jgi:hypothetical protein
VKAKERCNGCDLPIKAGEPVERCSDGTPYHGICFDIIAAALQSDISAEVKKMRASGKWHELDQLKT